MPKRTLPDGLVERVKDWLGEEGIAHFRQYKRTYGEVSPVYMEGGLPHVVHFREGMQVRNYMRKTGLCSDWDSHDYDDSWTSVIEEAIK
jgi:hypothetical protein